MKTKICFRLSVFTIFAICLIFAFNNPINSVYAEGIVTESSSVQYLEICEANDLLSFAERVNAGETQLNAKLMTNIDLSTVCYPADAENGVKETSWMPIGSSANMYAGTFDGQGYRIDNLYINTTTAGAGLFGVVNAGFTLRNLVVSGNVISTQNFVAGLVGYSNCSGSIIIENCGNEVNVTTSGANAAGIIGCNYGSYASFTITNCYNTGNIVGGKESAAISGWLGNGAEVRNCWNSGSITGVNIGNEFARFNSVTFTNCHQIETAGKQSNVANFNNYDIISGKLAYILNGYTSEGNLTWYQNLQIANTYPVFDKSQGVVYASAPCMQFSNSPFTEEVNHIQDDGIYSEPSCVEPGYTTYHCANCYEFMKIEVNQPANGHDFSNGDICSICNCEELELDWFSNYLFDQEFTINTVDEFIAFARITQEKAGFTKPVSFEDKTIKLGANLDFTNVPIYNNSDSENVIDNMIASFDGAFDGQGHTISNLTFNYVGDDTISSLGLFPNAVKNISNLKIDKVNTNIVYNGANNTTFNFGTLGKSIGNANNIQISNITVNCEVSSGKVSVGGLFSRIDGLAEISNCSVTNFVFNSNGNGSCEYLGGMVSYAEGSSWDGIKFLNCYTENMSFIVNNATYGLGGFMGFSVQSSYSNCEAKDVDLISVSETKQFCLLGGFASRIRYANVTDCKATNITIKNNPTQKVNAYDFGGFLGYVHQSSTFTNCSVNNLTIEADANNVAGFYGYAYWPGNVYFNDCSVTNINLKASGNYITGNWAGFAGANEGGTYHYNNCTVQGEIISNTNNVGGFQFTNSSVSDYTNCVIDINIYAKNAIAGLVAISGTDGVYTNCLASGIVIVADEKLFVTDIEGIIETGYYIIHNGGNVNENEEGEEGLFPTLTKANYSFMGYFEESDFSGSPIYIPEENKIYYAKWGNSLTYNPNSPVGTAYNIEFEDGIETTTVLAHNDETLGYLREGYTFMGWNTKADGTGTSYADNDTLTFNGQPITLYAQWTLTIDVFTLHAVPSYTYSGEAITPSLKLVYTDSGEDASSQLKDITYTSNINAGTATINFKIGEDTTLYSTDFVIEKAYFDLSNVTLANTELIYNGSLQIQSITNLPQGANVTYSDGFINVGKYAMYAEVTMPESDNYKETSKILIGTFEIKKATYDMSNIKFEDLKVTYDGKSHSIEIEGELPEGISVTYENNGQTEAGVYIITAHFVGDGNHNDIASMYATLIIEEKVEKTNLLPFIIISVLSIVVICLGIATVVIIVKKKKVK